MAVYILTFKMVWHNEVEVVDGTKIKDTKVEESKVEDFIKALKIRIEIIKKRHLYMQLKRIDVCYYHRTALVNLYYISVSKI